jgi:hypothetical protein
MQGHFQQMCIELILKIPSQKDKNNSYIFQNILDFPSQNFVLLENNNNIF